MPLYNSWQAVRDEILKFANELLVEIGKANNAYKSTPAYREFAKHVSQWLEPAHASCHEAAQRMEVEEAEAEERERRERHELRMQRGRVPLASSLSSATREVAGPTVPVAPDKSMRLPDPPLPPWAAAPFRVASDARHTAVPCQGSPS